ncbi:hypothetical protein BDAP_002849 [Binucleata daphniae]
MKISYAVVICSLINSLNCASFKSYFEHDENKEGNNVKGNLSAQNNRWSASCQNLTSKNCDIKQNNSGETGIFSTLKNRFLSKYKTNNVIRSQSFSHSSVGATSADKKSCSKTSSKETRDPKQQATTPLQSKDEKTDTTVQTQTNPGKTVTTLSKIHERPAEDDDSINLNENPKVVYLDKVGNEFSRKQKTSCTNESKTHANVTFVNYFEKTSGPKPAEDLMITIKIIGCAECERYTIKIYKSADIRIGIDNVWIKDNDEIQQINVTHWYYVEEKCLKEKCNEIHVIIAKWLLTKMKQQDGKDIKNEIILTKFTKNEEIMCTHNKKCNLSRKV